MMEERQRASRDGGERLMYGQNGATKQRARLYGDKLHFFGDSLQGVHSCGHRIGQMPSHALGMSNMGRSHYPRLKSLFRR